MMDDPVSLISSLGFPIFVCIWFMIRTEKIITNNTTALNTNTTVLQNLIKRLK